jgi:hypothetical protein
MIKVQSENLEIKYIASFFWVSLRVGPPRRGAALR